MLKKKMLLFTPPPPPPFIGRSINGALPLPSPKGVGWGGGEGGSARWEWGLFWPFSWLDNNPEVINSLSPDDRAIFELNNLLVIKQKANYPSDNRAGPTDINKLKKTLVRYLIIFILNLIFIIIYYNYFFNFNDFFNLF